MDGIVTDAKLERCPRKYLCVVVQIRSDAQLLNKRGLPVLMEGELNHQIHEVLYLGLILTSESSNDKVGLLNLTEEPGLVSSKSAGRQRCISTAEATSPSLTYKMRCISRQ